MDEKTSQEFDRLDSELSEAIVVLNATLPNMQILGRELVRKLGRDEAARVTQNVLAENLSVQEFVKAVGPSAVIELAQFVIGETDKLDLEHLARRGRKSI